jgi:predicted phosphodiesterase
MKIALFSDIHANLPALEACLTDMERHTPDAVYCLGDLVGYNIWPNEVINEIRRRKIPTLAGNYDLEIGNRSEEPHASYKIEPEKSIGLQSVAFTHHAVKSSERKYLSTLPSHIRLEYKLNNETFDLLMVHGSPRKINEYLFVDFDETDLLNMMENAKAHFLFFGHTHKPYHRILRDQNGKYRHVVNIGSVGKPKDGDPRGCYVLVSINEDSSLIKPDSIKIKIIRFKYDVEMAAQAIVDSPLPNEFADMLRKAY